MKFCTSATNPSTTGKQRPVPGCPSFSWIERKIRCATCCECSDWRDALHRVPILDDTEVVPPMLRQWHGWITKLLPGGSVAQSVEQRPFKALVPGSSPGRPSFYELIV